MLLIALLVQVAAAENVPADGARMIAQAAEQMGSYDALQCRVRQRVRLFGQQLTGRGSYQQARLGEHLHLRLEIKLPIGDQTTHLLQINDGKHLWIRRIGLDEQRLAVVDVRKVRAAWAEGAGGGEPALAIGGISQLLFGIHQQFQFSSPRPGMLGTEPVWILEGTWKATVIAGQGGGAEGLPQVPDAVLVVLSRDELLPLFPFRIEYYRDETDEKQQSQRETTMSIEFFEVGMLHNVDARNFTYSAGEQDIDDETDAFLERLGKR